MSRLLVRHPVSARNRAKRGLRPRGLRPGGGGDGVSGAGSRLTLQRSNICRANVRNRCATSSNATTADEVYRAASLIRQRGLSPRMPRLTSTPGWALRVVSADNSVRTRPDVIMSSAGGATKPDR